jgi:hypothetical protein
MTDNGSIEKLRERIRTYEQAIAMFESTRAAMLVRRRNAHDHVKVHIDSTLATQERALKSLQSVLDTAQQELRRALQQNSASTSPFSAGEPSPTSPNQQPCGAPPTASPLRVPPPSRT